MKVLIACEFSGTAREAFHARGHDAWSCDLLPSGDFRSVIQDSWDFIRFHYECRVMANSGVRWLTDKAAEIFNITLRDPRPGYSENSIMHCHAKERIDREQDQTIQPWWFGVPKFKGTCLWVRGIPPLAPTDKLIPPKKGTPEHRQWSTVHLASPGPTRWKERSRTFPGVANAMASQWGNQDDY